MLLKTFAANYNKLLQQSIDNASGAHLSNQQKKKGAAEIQNTYFQSFFIAGKSIVKCCLPFKIYARKLSNGMSALCMQYSKIDSTS